MSEKLELTGKKFGYLRILSFKETKNWMTFWNALCICGKECVVPGASVKSGHTKTCGCRFNKQKHGMTKTRFYNIWRGMFARVYKQPKKYPHHRGLTVERRWRDFKNFRDDMYESYLRHVKEFGEKNTSIDRVDNGKGYSGKNCRWATIELQLLNRKNTIYLSDGKSMKTLKEWAMMKKQTYNTLYTRYRRGWSDSAIINGKK